MIIVDSKQAEALEVRHLTEEQVHQEPPPTYASLQQASSSTQTLTGSSGNPTNYISVTRVHDSLRENITIDPTLYVPDFLLPPLSHDETPLNRKHLRFESTHGSITASVRIANSFGPDRRKVLMFMRSTHGGISARIVCLSDPLTHERLGEVEAFWHFQEGNEPRHPFQLIAHSANGNITLRLPRSFQGPIMISLRHGSVKFSDGINRNLTTFGEANRVRHCFVGDFSRWADSGKDWTGDEVIIEAKHGGVKIHYEDDMPGSVVRARPSLLNRVFGF